MLFILGLKNLSHPKTSRTGNTTASVGMLIAIVTTLIAYGGIDYKLVVLGIIIGSLIGGIFATKVEMTGMPQMVALFNGFGGGASALVAAAEFYTKAAPSVLAGDTNHFLLLTIGISVFVGTLTITGSFIAFAKLQGLISGQPIVFKGQQVLNALFTLSLITAGSGMVLSAEDMMLYFLGVVALAAILGITLTIPIGGADMPVVISLLNSYSGVAAAATGHASKNK